MTSTITAANRYNKEKMTTTITTKTLTAKHVTIRRT